VTFSLSFFRRIAQRGRFSRAIPIPIRRFFISGGRECFGDISIVQFSAARNRRELEKGIGERRTREGDFL